MSPPTIRGLEAEVEELSIKEEECSCVREVSNCGERWWWGEVVVVSYGGKGAVVSKKWWSCGESLEEQVRLLVGSPGASTTPIYFSGSSSTLIYSSGSSTYPRYFPGASTPQEYSLGTSRNAECSNFKHLLDKITVLEATVDMYMHPEQHIVNSAALFYEVYNNMRKLDLE
nr:hypothetical protein [Tanacetum cinerariifolium]